MININGVKCRDIQVNAEKSGYIVGISRDGWESYDPAPEMSYYSLSYPGITRAYLQRRGQSVKNIKATILTDKESLAVLVPLQS